MAKHKKPGGREDVIEATQGDPDATLAADKALAALGVLTNMAMADYLALSFKLPAAYDEGMYMTAMVMGGEPVQFIIERLVAMSPFRSQTPVGTCPPEILNSVIRFGKEGTMPGDFLRAVLENDLMEASRRADGNNAMNLHAIVATVYTVLPGAAWGSRDKVNKWPLVLASSPADHVAAIREAIDRRVGSPEE